MGNKLQSSAYFSCYSKIPCDVQMTTLRIRLLNSMRAGVAHLFVILWIALIGCVYIVFLKYKEKPGELSPSPASLSDGAPRLRAEMRMFVHPLCPCSQAGLKELAFVLNRMSCAVDTEVIFVCPKEITNGCEQTLLWRQAERITGVVVRHDPGGLLAKRFGVRTSGQVIVHDRAGVCVFCGGITSGRGHAGDNPGRRGLIAILKGECAYPLQTPVFGCPLFSSVDPSEKECASCRS
jgi:hypothetical protein